MMENNLFLKFKDFNSRHYDISKYFYQDLLSNNKMKSYLRSISTENILKIKSYILLNKIYEKAFKFEIYWDRINPLEV